MFFEGEIVKFKYDTDGTRATFKLSKVIFSPKVEVLKLFGLRTNGKIIELEPEFMEVVDEKFLHKVPHIIGEKWYDIKEYEQKYQLSNYGRVKSLNHYGRWNCEGLLHSRILGLYKEGKCKGFTLHQLIVNLKIVDNVVESEELWKPINIGRRKLLASSKGKIKGGEENYTFYIEEENNYFHYIKYNEWHFNSKNVFCKNSTPLYEYAVHYLVAKAFIPNPNNFKYARHINKLDYWNNSVENIEWCPNPYIYETPKSKCKFLSWIDEECLWLVNVRWFRLYSENSIFNDSEGLCYFKNEMDAEKLVNLITRKWIMMNKKN